MLKKLDYFKNINVVIIGDIILDKYIFGDVNRISPEAPIQIVNVIKEKHMLGGAANVASNIAALDGKAFLFGVVGNDKSKDLLFERMKNHDIDINGVIVDEKRTTTKKIRVLSKNQQLLRIDYEDVDFVDENITDQIVNALECIRKIDIIIISDYAKGLISQKLMDEINSLVAKDNIKIIVDPKPANKKLYKNAYLITPNMSEAEQLTNMHITKEDRIVLAGKKLIKELNCNVIITRGSEGMSVFNKDQKINHLTTLAQEVYDVSGAGDTVIATLGMALSANMKLDDAAFLANIAGGIKVGKLGATPVSLNELKEKLRKVNNYK
jgi:rfaE bifunctional protein kinase chain/domain